jgi:DNA invertase Pin-like site-specific DNA recombinase
MATRAAIYARVSTSDGGQNPDNQLTELSRFARAQGWTVVQEYVDNESGKTAKRVAFRRLFLDAAKRRFDVVLFWALDRFTREGALETLQHLNTLSGYGIGYRSFTEPYLDSCGMFKDSVIAILGTIAKQERVRLSERVKARPRTREGKGHAVGEADRPPPRGVQTGPCCRAERQGNVVARNRPQHRCQCGIGTQGLPEPENRFRRMPKGSGGHVTSDADQLTPVRRTKRRTG